MEHFLSQYHKTTSFFLYPIKEALLLPATLGSAHLARTALRLKDDPCSQTLEHFVCLAP